MAEQKLFAGHTVRRLRRSNGLSQAALAEARRLMANDAPDPAEFQRIYGDLRRSMPGVDPFWIDWRAWAFRRGLLDTKGS